MTKPPKEKRLSWAAIYRRKEPCPLCGDPKSWKAQVCRSCHKAMWRSLRKTGEAMRWPFPAWQIDPPSLQTRDVMGTRGGTGR